MVERSGTDKSLCAIDHGDMASAPDWRQQLLGSLQGQIQLATYLAVFVGFTGASCAGLWVSERALFQEHGRELQRQARAINANLDRLTAQQVAAAEDIPLQLTTQISAELGRFSDYRTLYWAVLPDGSTVVPDSKDLAMEQLLVRRAMAVNPDPRLLKQRVLSSGEQQYLIEALLRSDTGVHLWAARDITSSSRAFSNYLSWMILIWGICLLLTLASVTWLVRRIVRPLIELSQLTETVTVATLQSSHISLAGAPQEVARLAVTYEDLMHRLSQSWSQQRQFVSGVSHELRTPLTIVSGYIRRTLRRGDNLRPDQVEGLQTADGETRRMRHLLDDLLDLSRGDSGRLSLTSTPVKLEPLLKELIELAGSDQRRPLLLDLPDQANQATALADADRLKQVLLNLLENACKYSPEATPVCLRLRPSPGRWQLQVLDEGMGVPASDRERIFERFQRGSNAPPGGGSGLGLSVVKLLVEAMGGSISVIDAERGGSCFIVELSSVDSP